MDNQSLAHSRYNCTYHIVFIPKYRRKVMYGKLRAEVGEILGKVCKMEDVTIIKAGTLPDHVHMYVSIPPKVSISKTIGRIKGKSALMIFLIVILNIARNIIGISGQGDITAKLSVMLMRILSLNT